MYAREGTVPEARTEHGCQSELYNSDRVKFLFFLPSVPAGGESSEQGQGRVRTLLDPLKPLVSQIKRLHLLLPDCQPALEELGPLFPLVVSAPQLAHIIGAFLRFYQISLHQLQLDQKKTR